MSSGHTFYCIVRNNCLSMKSKSKSTWIGNHSECSGIDNRTIFRKKWCTTPTLATAYNANTESESIQNLCNGKKKKTLSKIEIDIHAMYQPCIDVKVVFCFFFFNNGFFNIALKRAYCSLQMYFRNTTQISRPTKLFHLSSFTQHNRHSILAIDYIHRFALISFL